MPPPRGKGRFSKDRKPKRNTQSLLFRRKRFCRFTVTGVKQIDYKDTTLLRTYISERGKIRARRVTGNCVQHQRDIAIAVKNAREVALLPFTSSAR